MFRIEHDVATGKVNEIPLTEQEMKQGEKDNAKFVKERKEKLALAKAEAEAKATARQAVLDRLGLTAEEAQLLLGGN